jgi:hypothetical protein
MEERSGFEKRMAEDEKKRQTFWGNRGVNNAFVIAFVISMIFLFVRPVNRIEDRRLNNSGITTYGQIIGIWQISEQQSMAIYMFPIDNIYHTGRFEFSRGYNIHKGDRVRVIYLENRPNVSRAVEVLPLFRE